MLEKIMPIIIGAIRIVLFNEGYSSDRIRTAIAWNYADIKDFVEGEVNKNA